MLSLQNSKFKFEFKCEFESSVFLSLVWADLLRLAQLESFESFLILSVISFSQNLNLKMKILQNCKLQ